MDSPANPPPAGPGLFPETRWTLVLAARFDPAKRRPALEELVRPRWRALTSQRQEERAAKRGGGQRPADLADVEAWVASPDAAPDVLFDRAWALSMFAEALNELEGEYTSGARRVAETLTNSDDPDQELAALLEVVAA